MIAPVVAAALAAPIAAAGLTVARGLHRRRPAPPSASPPTGLLDASRGVAPWWNASAIGAEHLSAAAYLGTAGLVLAYGADMLWLPVAGTAGYVLLLAFVAAPLRRSGAYTVPDFAEWRLGSRAVRRIAACCVCLIGCLFLLPQFQGAGVTLHLLTGAPLWTGWAVVAAVVLLIVLHGGVRGITAVQAVQFWGKLAAMAVPAVALLALWNLDGRPGPAADAPPHFERTTRVQVRTEAAVTVPRPVTVVARGRVDGAPFDGEPVRLAPGPHTIGRGTEVVFPAGAAVPHAEGLPVKDGRSWATPFGAGEEHGLFRTCSALLGIALGTMGLPHILMRFYTNTSGSDARRTAAYVPCLLALFSVFPVLYGTLGRLYAPELLMTGDADAALLLLPQRMFPGPGGALLTCLITAGAFAAFISTSCGIVVSLAGTLSRCVRRRCAAAFRCGVVAALAVPPAVLPDIGAEHAAALVTMALSVSACSLCPLLVLAIWWRGLTAAGAAAGLLTGAGLTVAAAAAGLSTGPGTGGAGAVLAQPTLIAAPAVFAVMAGVSLLTRHRVPRHAGRALASMHLPESPAAPPPSAGTSVPAAGSP